MDEQLLNERPLLRKYYERSSKDWGVAPKYNEEYRKIRWPSTVDINGKTRKPSWIYEIREDLSRKMRGNWNPTSSTEKTSTHSALMEDINFCIAENIPFKTRTIEYKPATTTLHIGEAAEVHYDLFSGCIKSFTYGGVYSKVVSYFFRALNIYVKKVGRVLIWSSSYKGDTIIDINTTYRLPVIPTAPSLYSIDYTVNVKSHSLYQEMREYLHRRDAADAAARHRDLFNSISQSIERSRPTWSWDGTTPQQQELNPAGEIPLGETRQILWPSNINWLADDNPVIHVRPVQPIDSINVTFTATRLTNAEV